MSIDRTSLVRGPALVTYKSPKDSTTIVKFQVKEDFNINDVLETMIINTSARKHVDERKIEATSECSFVPAGVWKQSIIDAIWTPFASYPQGYSLLDGLGTATDLPLVANAVDGEIHSITSAAITKLPDIYLSAKKTLVGSMSMSGFRAKGTGWGGAGSLRTIQTTGGTTASVDSTFSPAQIIVQPYLGVWGTVAGFTAMDTVDGWTISFNLKADKIGTDASGNILIVFDEISVMAKCMPVGPTSSQILAAQNFQGASAYRGQSMQDGSSDLVISGVHDSGHSVTLHSAQLKTSGYRFGANVLRNGEIGFVATYPFTAGVPGALFAIASSIP